VGDPQVEGAAQDRALVLERLGIAEVCHSPSDTSGSMIPLRPAGTADGAP
jgi:hypothetical protein